MNYEDLEARLDQLEEEIKTKLTWWKLVFSLGGLIVGILIVRIIFNYFGW